MHRSHCIELMLRTEFGVGQENMCLLMYEDRLKRLLYTDRGCLDCAKNLLHIHHFFKIVRSSERLLHTIANLVVFCDGWNVATPK